MKKNIPSDRSCLRVFQCVERRKTTSLFSVILLLCAHLLPLSAAEFFVAPSGKDTNAGTKEAPFRTIEGARDAVRKLTTAGLKKDVTVYFSGGTYLLDETVLFDSRDSGTAEHKILYTAYDDKPVVFSGGRRLEGQWTPHKGDIWKLDLPGVAAGDYWFRQLFLDDGKKITRKTRARWPNAGSFARMTTVDNKNFTYGMNQSHGTKVTPSDNAEVQIFVSWVSSRARVLNASDTAFTAATLPGNPHPLTMPKKGQSFFLEHSLGFIDVPGEWYLDRKSGSLYLMMNPGEDPNDATFYSGRIEQHLRITGTVENPVRNLHFRRLRFHYSFWELPEIGYGDMWTGNYGSKDGTTDWVRHIPLAVQAEYFVDSTFEQCEIAHMGASGIGFGRGVRNTRVVGCHIHDISAIGINFGWRTNASPDGDGWVHFDRVLMTDVTRAWGGNAHVPGDNAITDNLVHHCGQVYAGCAGIFIAFQRNFDVSHNEVFGLPYGNIILQHFDGEREKSVSSYNHVYNSMLLLGDGGGIYTSVTDVGAHIHHNYVHDIVLSPGAVAWGNVGIFLDDYSTKCLVEHNALFNVATADVKFRSSPHHLRFNRGVRKMLYQSKAVQKDITIDDPAAQQAPLTESEKSAILKIVGPREPHKGWLATSRSPK